MPPINLPKPGVFPFWFWNGVQNEAVIREQLKAMKDGGCRGVVLHSRTGNKIPYLSDRWFELMVYSCECAQQLGLKVWLYDEDGYPSGNAGMQVQALRPDLRQKHLVFEYAPTDPDNPCYAAYDPATYALIDETKVPKGTPALRFKTEFIARHVDCLSRESVDLFMSLTHAKYEKHLGKFFGSVIEAVYTDDESYQVWNGYGIVWSETLEGEFSRRFGIGLKSVLPMLVEDLPGADAVRFNFYSLARELFLKNFIEPQVDWCRRNGLSYTGHLCGDEGPTRMCIKNFGTSMPYMMTEDIPAIDDYLCELMDHGYLRTAINGPETRFLHHDPNKLFTLYIYKCASSIANQFKDGLVSAEVLTFLGWNIKPDFLNTQMMFELGMGVNLMTPHAYYYTLGDGTRNDCPPSYFTQQPYYDVFGKRCATWTQIAELLMRGKFHAECLVIYPSNILTTQAGPDMVRGFKSRNPRAGISPDDFDEQFSTLLMNLSRRHIGYDLGEESIVADNAVIHSGVMTVDKMAYHTVVVFPGVPLTASTETLLGQFESSGGSVITLPHGHYDALDAVESDVKISGDGCEEILVHARENGDFRELYLLNLSGKTLTPKISLEDEFVIYDPVEQKGVYHGTDTPEDFTMEPGALCMILPKSFDCETVPFAETVFCGNRKWVDVYPASISMLRKNIAAFHDTTGFKFVMEEGASVDAIYTEHLVESGLKINSAETGGALLPHHPCDHCFDGVAVSGLCRSGENRIELGTQRDMIYLEGDFILENGVLRKPTALASGNLADAGYPHYWGGVEYTFHFTGNHDLMRFELAGAADVSINGKHAGVVFGKPATLRISELCGEGGNTAVVRLFNTAANFVTAQPVPFGISRTQLA